MIKQHYYFDMPDETYKYIIRKNILSESKKEKTILDLCRNGEPLKSIMSETGYYKNNIVLIITLGHILCSKFGIIYDTFDPRKRAAEYCWLVE